jgi:hypothetical protein
MNKIYLVNSCDSNDNYEIHLEFKNNTFEKEDMVYDFNIPSHDKIVIDNNLLYYTEDSYLYYIDIHLKDKIKKIFLVHTEWNDQAIINLHENKLIRINHPSEYGLFERNENTLIIHWEKWGKEVFIQWDDYTYVKENYIDIDVIESNLNEILIPIHIFIHVCMIENWAVIFKEQIDTLKKSGLYEKCEKIHIGLLGDISNISNDIFKESKFTIMYIDSRIDLYEINTINFIKYFCSHLDYDIHLLYIHTKGVRKAGNEDVTKSWREMMQYFLIENYLFCIKNLEIYDTIGNNVVNMHENNISSINKNHSLHYSGNFWWSKKSYIDKLPYLDLDLIDPFHKRYLAENWILSLYPDARVGFLFQDDTNTHPYHRYVFDYYKRMKIHLKCLRSHTVCTECK